MTINVYIYIPGKIMYNEKDIGFRPENDIRKVETMRMKKLVALLLTLCLCMGALIVPAAAAEEEGVVIKLHYNRPDGEYADWSVWFWNLGEEGVDIPFEKVKGEMVATYKVKPGVTTVGYIVKLPNWAAKDVEMDQFIDIAAYTSGTVHVYVESRKEGHEVKLGDDVVSGIKLTNAKYDEKTGVVISMTAAVKADAFTLKSADGTVIPATVTEGEKFTYTLTTAEPLDLYSGYNVSFMGQDYPVKMPNVYSTESFEKEFTYTGSDLGANWTKESTLFRVWAPTATAVRVNLYESGTPGTKDRIEQLEMTADVNGTWIAQKEGDLNGVYYTYEVDVNGVTNEACDPYAKAVGVNGKRAMVIDMDSTDPEGWAEDKGSHSGNITDAVIYELHVRDLSVNENSGITNKGKYLGLIETGTTSPDGIPTGLDHIKDLGVTHIHLLPSYDYGSVDETKLEDNAFNWGYDPVNYNVPEGSYSTDPYHGEVRVKEFKQMVKGLHDNDMNAIMDVVYNHVYNADAYCFNQIVPQYFSRVTDGGVYSGGSGCGNDTASERAMVSKYIVDSVKYWADEYHIDGFRFDLVGLIDTQTINTVIEEVHKTHPNVIFYGEGWTMNTHMTKEGYTLTTQANSTETPKFAFFSDTIRDALKGDVFDSHKPGYVSGVGAFAGNIKDCFVGAPTWCKSPTQTINYASCHDNNTLFDRITTSTPDVSVADRIRMNNLAAAIYMTAQGTPFIHAGEEMLRSKPLPDGGYDHNSYRSSDAINNLKWEDLAKEEYQSVYNYYKGLIAFRKAHPALRMISAEEVAQKITALDGLDFSVTGFHIAAGANGEEGELVILFNPRTEATTVTLPEGQWDICVSGDKAGTESLGKAEGTVTVEAISATMLTRLPAAQEEVPEESEPAVTQPSEPATEPEEFPVGAYVAIGAAVLVAVIAVVIALKKKNKK